MPRFSCRDQWIPDDESLLTIIISVFGHRRPRLVFPSPSALHTAYPRCVYFCEDLKNVNQEYLESLARQAGEREESAVEDFIWGKSISEVLSVISDTCTTWVVKSLTKNPPFFAAQNGAMSAWGLNDLFSFGCGARLNHAITITISFLGPRDRYSCIQTPSTMWIPWLVKDSFSWSILGIFLLGQWLNFKLLGIPYLVGKITRSNFFFRVHWLSKFLESTEHLNPFRITLPETNSSPLQIVRAPKGNNRIPTIHFQVLWLLVSRRVNVDESHSRCFGIVLMRGWSVQPPLASQSQQIEEIFYLQTLLFVGCLRRYTCLR